MPTPRQAAAAAAVASTVRAGTQPGTPGIGTRARLVPAMLRDSYTGRFPALTRARLLLLLLGVLYIISPIDLVPESALLLVGLTDDVLVAGWVVAALLDASGEYALWRQAGQDAEAGAAGAADAAEGGGATDAAGLSGSGPAPGGPGGPGVPETIVPTRVIPAGAR